MLDDFILDDLDTFEDIDTSDVDFGDSDTDSSDFFETFGVAGESDFTGYDDFDSFTSDEHLQATDADSDMAEESHVHHTEKQNYASRVSFGSWYGNCHHTNCLCKKYEGDYGAVCKNCYHGFDKHY